MNSKNNITHRTQAIIGLRAANRNNYGVPPLGSSVNRPEVQNDKSDYRYNDTESRDPSHHSVETSFTDNISFNHNSQYYDESSFSETIDSSQRPIHSEDSSVYVENSDLERLGSERSDSWASVSLYTSSRRISASVIGSLKTRSLANRRTRRCFDIFFILFVLLTLGLVTFGFVFQERIRKSPMVESLVGKKTEREEQYPSQTPSITLGPTIGLTDISPIPTANLINEANISSMHPSQAPSKNTSVGPTNIETVVVTSSSYPSLAPHGTSITPSIANSSKPTIAPTPFTEAPSNSPVSWPSSVPNQNILPHKGSTKAPAAQQTSSPSLTVIPSMRITLPRNSSDSPTLQPTISPTFKVCNSSSHEDRKSRYDGILKSVFYDPSTSDGSEYNALMNWITSNTFLDVCDTVEQLLLERMVWASVYFAINANYTNANGRMVRTLENYLTDGPHCNRSDDRVAYSRREWEVKCNIDGYITEFEIFGKDDSNEGKFPVEIVHLTKLKKIIINDSPKVTGTIPDDLFTIADLEYIDFTNLGLSGSLFPPSFFALNNPHPLSKRLKVLKLGSDASLLSTWYKLDKSLMKEPSLSNLYHNWFANLTMNNYNSSVFPSEEISSFERLETLHIENANIVGTIPDLHEMVTLKSFSLWGNKLTGQIPAFPPGIEVIRLKKNMLNGTIPSTMGQYINLTALELGNNPLGGTIPATLGNLTKLNSLHLYDSNLDGTIPDSISLLSNLQTLFLEDNHLSGSIPAEVGLFQSHESTVDLWIDLSNNNLVGTLPVFSQSLNLNMFKASRNRLEGSIPPSLLQNYIWYIHLDGNLLSGAIPSSEQGMYDLEELILHDNELTGQIIPLNGGRTARKQTYHDNYIRGTLDPAICLALNDIPLAYHLTADCNKYVECECCTECYDGKIVTTRPSLSPIPSQRPSIIPTKSPRPSFIACPTPPPKKDSKSSPSSC